MGGGDFLLFVLLASLAIIGAGLVRDGQARAGLTSLERVRLALSESGLPRGNVTRVGAAVIAAYFVTLGLIDMGRGAWAGAAVDAATSCLFVAVVGVGDRVAAGLAALLGVVAGLLAVALLASSGALWQVAVAATETIVLAVFAAFSIYLAPADRRARLLDHLERRARRGGLD